MNASVLERLLRAVNGTSELAGCCDGSALPAERAEERAQLVARLVQIAVLCVLSLTVLFGVFCLGCNLMMRSESMVDFLLAERRAPEEAGGGAGLSGALR